MINRPARIATLIVLLGSVTPAFAQYCKWVDDAGVVHYAEECPDDVRGSTVYTPPAPTEAEVEAAMQRSEALRAGRGQRDHIAAPEDEAQDSASVLREPAVSCDEAFRTLEILDLQLPVYYDDQRRLHYRDSLHHHWYQGPRIYLDEEARDWQSERIRERIDAQCTTTRPARPAFTVRFLNAPNLQETIGLLRNAGDPQSPPLSDLCRYSDILAGEIPENAASMPADDIRYFQDLRGRHCR